MYNIAVVRQLCSEVGREKDPARVEQLIELLRAVVKEDREEIRMRMAYLKKKYADVIEDAQAAD